MSVIRFALDGQKLIPIESPTIASQGVLEDSVVFDFDSEWSGAGKVALFWRAEDEQRENVYKVTVDENNSAIIPWEVTQTDGEIGITVFGVRDSTIITADIYYYKIVEGLYTEGSGSQPPTPDIYQQILAIAGEVNGKFDVMNARVNNINALQTSGMLSGSRIEIYDHEDPIEFGTNSTAEVYVSSSDCSYIGNEDNIIIGVQFFLSPIHLADLIPENGVLIDWDYTAPLQPDRIRTGVNVTTKNTDWERYSGDVYLRLIWLVPYSEDLSELTDIRVAADSTTYQSAGAAVRGQVDYLEKALTELSNGKAMVFDITLTSGYIGNAGQIYNSTASNEVYTNMISVAEGEKVYIELTYKTNTKVLWLAVCEYDSGGTFLRRTVVDSASVGSCNVSQTVGQNTASVRVTWRTYDGATVYILRDADFTP